MIQTINKYAIIILFIISVLVYIPSLPNQFLWDDEEQIARNPAIQSVSNIPNLLFSGIVNSQTGQLTGGYYRPLVTISYTLLYTLGHGSPLPFRIFQVMLHAINTVFVYLLFLELFSKNSDKKYTKLVCFSGALLFSLHPGIAEAVLFNAGLGEPLFVMLFLLSFLYLTRFVYNQKKPYLLFVSLLFLLSLLTKEIAVIFIPLAFLYIFYFTDKKSLKPISLSVGFSIFIYIVLRLVSVGTNISNELYFPTPIAKLDVLNRFLTTPYIFVYYLFLSIFPFYLSIAQHPIVTSLTHPRFVFPLGILISIIVILFLITKRFKNKLLLFFTAWFILGIIPVLNIIPLSSSVAERWLYFPLIGLIGILCLIVISNQKIITKHKYIFAVLFIFITLIYGVKTVMRSLQWRSGFTLYTNDIKVNPNSFDLVNNYGVELFRNGEEEESKQYFERSIELNPDWWTAYNNLGAVYEREGNNQKAEKLYKLSTEKGNYYLAYVNIAMLLAKEKRFNEAVEFINNILPYYQNSFELRYFLVISLYKLEQYNNATQQAHILYRLYPTEQSYNLLQGVMNKTIE